MQDGERPRLSKILKDLSYNSSLFVFSIFPPTPPSPYDVTYMTKPIDAFTQCVRVISSPLNFKSNIFRNHLKKSSSIPRVASPKGEALLCDPQGEILAGCPVSPLGLISFLNNVRRYRRRLAPESEMLKMD